MPGKINLYNLGTQGVDLTKSIIHAEDGSFRKAQNAVPDPRGKFGAVSMRDGLIEINSTSAGGEVKGILNMPLPSQRNIYVGRHGTGTTGQTWITSTDDGVSFASTANIANATDYGYFNSCNSPKSSTTQGLELMDRAAFNGNVLIYPATGYTQYIPGGSVGTGTGPPTLRMWDGVTDRELLRVPLNLRCLNSSDQFAHLTAPDNVGNQAIYVGDMLMEGQTVYFIVFDFANGEQFMGRVLSFNLATYALEQIGETFGPATTDKDGGPFCLGLGLGRLWLGTGNGTQSYPSDPAPEGKVYRIRPGIDSTWTLDATFNSTETVVSICSYAGRMYAGTFDQNAGAPAPGRLMARGDDGVWASIDTTGAAPTAAGSRVSCLIEFEDNLYWVATDMRGVTSSGKIKKWDGTTASTVRTFDLEDQGGTNFPQMGLSALKHNGRLFMLVNVAGGGTSFYNDGKIAYSDDGTTWVEIDNSTTQPIIGRAGVVIT